MLKRGHRRYRLQAILFLLIVCAPTLASSDPDGKCLRGYGPLTSFGVGRTIHYKGQFELVPGRTGSVAKVWRESINEIFFWLRGKHSDLSFNRVTSHSLATSTGATRLKDAKIEVRSLPGADPQAPKHWVLRHEQLDENFPQNGRRWRTDIALTTMGDRVTVHVTTEYWTEPRFFGTEAPPPDRTVPGIVPRFLTRPRWHVATGTLPVEDRPIQLTAATIGNLPQWIEDRDRRLPIIYVSRRYRDQGMIVDPVMLAKLLRGSAIVVTQDRASRDREDEAAPEFWVRSLPDSAPIPYNGAIGIYWPRSDGQGGYQLINPHGQAKDRGLLDNLEQLITQNVLRRHAQPLARPSGEVSGLEDLEQVRAKLALVGRAGDIHRLKQELDEARRQQQVEREQTVQEQTRERQAQQELLGLYEANDQEITAENQGLRAANENLSKDLAAGRDERAEIERERDHLRLANQGLTADVSRLQARISKLFEEKKRGNGHGNGANGSANGNGQAGSVYTEQQALARLPRDLPRTLEEVVPFMRQKFGDVLVITDKAESTLSDCEGKLDPLEVVDVLANAALYLPEIYLSDTPFEGGQPERWFHETTGYSYAAKEKPATENNAKYREQRTAIYRDQPVYFAAHIRMRNFMRVHFFVDTEQKKIVIGYIGEHLDTTGTRRSGR